MTDQQRAAALQRALAFVGVTEDPPGSNRGPKIDEWLNVAGVPPGSPWCASFATSRDVWGDDLPDGFPLASAYKLRAWGEAHGALVHLGALAPGDLFVIMHDAAHGHVGMVAEDCGDGTCATVEGNEGNRVARRTRSGGEFAAVVRV